MSDAKATAKLGNTSYELAKSSPGILKITRANSDGITFFFVPKDLITEYALQRAEEALLPLLRKAIQ